jgi:hypothetical protein
LVALLAGTPAWSARSTVAGPTPSSACGERATSWSEATAGGIQGRLVRLERDLPRLSGDPMEATRLALRLTLANGSSSPLALGLASFSLVACDGSIYAPVEDDNRRTLPNELAAGDGAVGWLVFALPAEVEPALLVLRASEGNACRAQLGFPLVLGAGGTADVDDAATPPAMPSCGGPSATAGAATGGVAGGNVVVGSDGADGGNAVGGNAVGGDGCAGADGAPAGSDGGDDDTDKSDAASDCRETPPA